VLGEQPLNRVEVAAADRLGKRNGARVVGRQLEERSPGR
jgi:hypothetical protein